MRVNHYTRPLLALAVDLLNRPVTGRRGLERRWTSLEMPLPAPVLADDLAEAAAYLREFGEVVDAESEQRRADLLNMLLSRHVQPGYITNHDGSEWHIHHSRGGSSFAEVLAAEITAAAAKFLTERGMRRLGRCAASGCPKAFVDFSAPGRQRYCGHACANREAVRRFRGKAPDPLRAEAPLRAGRGLNYCRVAPGAG